MLIPAAGEDTSRLPALATRNHAKTDGATGYTPLVESEEASVKRTQLLMAIVAFARLGLNAAVQAPEFPAGGAPANPAAAGRLTVAAQLNQQLSFVEDEFV